MISSLFKDIFILPIRLYQWILSPVLRGVFGMQCRYEPSCSYYMADAIKEWGVVKGIYLGTKRILSCHPWEVRVMILCQKIQKDQTMLSRPRRNRRSKAIRDMVAETHLSVDHLIYPLFLVDGNGTKEEIASLPGNFRWSLDNLLKEIEECLALGLRSYVLFPKVDNAKKDTMGSYGYASDNYYFKVVKELKARFPEATLISDVAMDPYSSDGHDGIVKDGKILNDETLEVLNKMSLAQAEAGFDILGPSDMMDGRVASIRETLDVNGFTDTSIMSYTAKYASAFYGALSGCIRFGTCRRSRYSKGQKNLPNESYQQKRSTYRSRIRRTGRCGLPDGQTGT